MTARRAGTPAAAGHAAPSAAEPARRGRCPGRLRRLGAWLYAAARAPEPRPAGPGDRRALAAVLLVAVAYAAAMTAYCFGLQDAFRTHAEELGIMDQVLWDTAHGHFMQESICNAIWGQNCLGDVSRFAIHFEPILIPLALLYLVVPNVKALLLIQAAGVASGAVPAFLLASRRLRHWAWGLAFAGAYLAYPPLLSAQVHDFHPETAAAGLVMWALYFLVVRRDRALIATCLVLVLCKETFTLDVVTIGLFAAVLQRRPRLGTGLVALGATTLLVALTLMHLASPVGRSPVAGRYAYLLHDGPGAVLRQLAAPARLDYLVKVLAPVGFLPLLSPWATLLAAPSLALNFLSSSSAMYSGSDQYNTDIGPALVFAAIEALVWLLPVVAQRVRRSDRVGRTAQRPARALRLPVAVGLPVLLAVALGAASYAPHAARYVDAWPGPTAHTRIGQQVLAAIPPDASVCAQSTLVPHLSERVHIHQFPDQDDVDEYVVLDETADYYPFLTRSAYLGAVQGLLRTGAFATVRADDGYLLLRRLTPPAADARP